MTVNRTTLLDLPLPVTGTESGVWGDVTNNGLTQYLDIAIAGRNALTSANFTGGALTLATTEGDSSATNIAAGSAQYATLYVSSLAANSTITAPSSNRAYRVVNADATYTLTVKAAGQTGVVFPVNTSGTVVFNGTDYVLLGSYVIASAGTASLPSITFTGDTNTGIFSPAADTIAFTEGGVEAMRINSSGNVGIGITDPQTALHVVSATNTTQLSISNTGTSVVTNDIIGAIGFKSGDNNRVLQDTDFAYIRTLASQTHTASAAGTNLTFGTTPNNSLVVAERMRIDSSGNVGIGTTSPATLLNVSTATTNVARLRVTGTGSTSGNYRGYEFASSGGFSGGIFQDEGTSALSFWSSSGGSSMVVDSSGNVTGANTTGMFRLANSARSALLPTYAFVNAADVGMYNPADGTLGFVTGQVERARITSGGDLLVGTTSAVNNWNNSLIKMRIANGIQFGDYSAIAEDLFDADSLGICYDSTENLCFGQYTIATTTYTERARITSGGEFYVAGTTDQGAYNIQCNGTGVWGAGAYVNGSDERLKDNITSIDSGLDVVTAMRPVTFTYKEDYSKDQSIQTGFIAQELQQAMSGKNYVDGIVQAGPEYLNVAYQNLIPILTKAIQELKAELDTVKAELATLKG